MQKEKRPLFLYNDLYTFRIREWGNPKNIVRQLLAALSSLAVAKSKLVDSLSRDNLFTVIQQLNQVHAAGQIAYEVALPFGIEKISHLTTGKIKDGDFVNPIVVIEFEKTICGIGEYPDFSFFCHGVGCWPNLCEQACCA